MCVCVGGGGGGGGGGGLQAFPLSPPPPSLPHIKVPNCACVIACSLEGGRNLNEPRPSAAADLSRRAS